ncbi:MAG: hypothetical protein EDR02_17340 [Actinobacteria bacterium]|nr:MAG: hypothetical protein EDR02_17340 [Actinomycetota bacterium]RIK07085.1 MAG: hypothetical protein DCC48_04645 [Acidobacteriota bacterium]
MGRCGHQDRPGAARGAPGEPNVGSGEPHRRADVGPGEPHRRADVGPGGSGRGGFPGPGGGLRAGVAPGGAGAGGGDDRRGGRGGEHHSTAHRLSRAGVSGRKTRFFGVRGDVSRHCLSNICSLGWEHELAEPSGSLGRDRTAAVEPSRRRARCRLVPR